MSRPKGSKNKPKQSILKSDIDLLLEQKRALPSGSQERIALGRRIKALQLERDNLLSSKINQSTEGLEGKKGILEAPIPLFTPEKIDNNCLLREYCLKNNQSQQFTCYCSTFLLNNGCSFYKARVK